MCDPQDAVGVASTARGRVLAPGERSPGQPVHRGSLTVFLGAAPGVGKTYAMLGEAERRAHRGDSVAVGLAVTHGRIDTEAMRVGLGREGGGDRPPTPWWRPRTGSSSSM